jgi:NYN domain
MTDNNLAIGKQTKQLQALVSIYGDHQNTHLTQILGSQLLEFAKLQGSLIHAKFYYNSLCDDQVYTKNKLERLSFKWIDVPCPLKNSADNQLIADCLEDIDSDRPLNTVILVSGDGDFVKLIRNLQKLGIKVIVFAQQGNVKQKLKDLDGINFYFLDELPILVASKTQHIENSQYYLTYHEAIECLIAAIKTASKQGQDTSFSYISNLMRKHFPKYQGVSSICKYQGKNFSKFSKFVETAVKDGKIRSKDGQLFVI